MSATSPCVPCCPTVQVTNIPGPEGADGTNGSNGINAFTVVTGGGFNVPNAVGGSASIPVANSQWATIGQYIIVQGPANFLITAVPTTTSITGTFLGLPGDVNTSTAIAAGATVSPAGQRGADSLFVASTAVNATLNAYQDVMLVTVDNKTITLPTAVGIQGKVYTIKQTATYSSGTTIATTGGQTIDGASTKTIGATNGAYTVISDGANWQIIAKV